jgi:hypothetical protein
MAVNTAGTYLYVISCAPSATLQCTGSPALTEYALSSGTIGSAKATVALALASPHASDVLVPTGLTVLANNGTSITGNAVFVTAYDQSAYNPGGTTTSSANPGWVFGFTIGSGGTLSPSPNSPYKAGIKPVAIAGTPTNEYVYVVDYASSQLIGYSVRDGDSLVFLINGPFRTGSLPTAIALDPRGKYIYVTDSISTSSGGGAVSTFVIDLATGTPSSLASTNNGTDTDPVAITVDAGVGTFVYTANNQGNSISGFDLSVDSGELTPTQASPYPSGSQPTAVVTAPAGSHAVETITP